MKKGMLNAANMVVSGVGAGTATAAAGGGSTPAETLSLRGKDYAVVSKADNAAAAGGSEVMIYKVYSATSFSEGTCCDIALCVHVYSARTAKGACSAYVR
jgi:hypothetical protein